MDRLFHLHRQEVKMSVKIHIPQYFLRITDGLDIVEAKGKNVGECLADLIGQYPDIEKEIFQRKGELSNHLEICVNAESAYPDELSKPVIDGDDIHLLMAITGG